MTLSYPALHQSPHRWLKTLTTTSGISKTTIKRTLNPLPRYHLSLLSPKVSETEEVLRSGGIRVVSDSPSQNIKRLQSNKR